MLEIVASAPQIPVQDKDQDKSQGLRGAIDGFKPMRM
jgi:hypothetical protein